MMLLGRLLAFILIAILPATAVLVYDPDGPHLRLHVAAALILGAMLGLFAAWVLRRRFVHEPLERLIACANALREGRYLPHGVMAARAGEFAPLATAFDDMAAQLAAREAALNESRATLQSLYDSAPTHMGVVELVGEDILHIYDNPATCRFFGRAPGSSTGRLASGLGAPPDAIREWVTHYRAAEASGMPVRFEYRHAARDEHRYWLMVTVAVIGPGPSGRTRFAYVAEDITERRRTEKALRESDERLRAALAASGTGTYRWDMRTGAAQGDEGHTTLFGGPVRSDKDFAERVYSEDRPKVVEMLRRCLKEGADFELDYRVLLPDGRVRWLSDRGRVFKDNDGRPLYMTGAVIDITERKAAEVRQSLLAAEVDHRAKNMLALVQVMLRQTRAATVKEYAAAALGRVAALGRAHTLLSESRWEGADLEKLMTEEIAPFRRTDSTRIRLSGPAVALSPRAAQVFAMAVHELATNAAKHGALSVAQGRASVDWSWRDDGRLALRWMEMGGPPVHAPLRRGLGMNVIERSIGQQLDGEVCFDWSPTGLVCELVVPASRLTKTAD